MVLFGFWQDWRTHISLFSQNRITDLVPDLIQNLYNLRRLRYKARINSVNTSLGLNASFSTRIMLTEMVFNWL